MPNINITLPDELHRKLKLRAVLEEKPLKTLVIETLDAAVESEGDAP